MKRGQYAYKVLDNREDKNYLRILEKVDKNHFRVEDSSYMRFIVNKKELIFPEMSSVCVSEVLLGRLSRGLCMSITHPVTPRYKSILKKQPSLIRFYTLMKSYEVVFTIKSITETVLCREKVVKIVVDSRV